jgi:BirA family biotin operon repressor/biotin-[acetyl-CoA-carboxylase] ligase
MLSHASICKLAGLASSSQRYGEEATRKILRYGAPVGCSIEHHQRLPRCMSRLRDLVAEGSSKSSPATGTVVRADELSDSSGRFDRAWHAPAGGLYLAVLWADTFLPQFSRLLPFAAGIACCETINAFAVDSHIKWVNDVHAGGLKIGGILSQMVIGPGDDRFHLTGIGLNVNTMSFPLELENTATSLQLLTRHSFDLDEVCCLLLARLQWNFGLLCYAEEQALAQGHGAQHTAMNLLLKRWLALSDTCGRKVQYGYDVQKEPLYQATVLEVNAEGGLVMELEDGSRLTEYSGEIMYLD